MQTLIRRTFHNGDNLIMYQTVLIPEWLSPEQAGEKVEFL